MTSSTTPQENVSLPGYIIKDLDLYELITTGYGHPNPRGFNIWSGNQNNKITYGLMIWLAMRSFKIERFPWHPDFRFTHPPANEQIAPLRSFLDEVLENPKKLDTMCQEIVTIADHCQQRLKNDGYGPTIRLKRSISDDASNGKYATKLANAANAAKFLGRPNILFPIDALSSWSRGSYPGNSVLIEADIPLTNIMWTDTTFARPRGSPSLLTELGEFVVINKRIDGNIIIKPESIHIINPNLLSLELEAISSTEQAERILIDAANNIKSSGAAFSEVDSVYYGNQPFPPPNTWSKRISNAWKALKDEPRTRSAMWLNNGQR